jgi:starvation-inducible DNA-binding protein
MTNALDIKPRETELDTGIDSEASVAAELADVLGDTYRLMFKTHAYHWNVTGPLFYSLHKLTETQYEDLFAAADVVAERIRALGQLTPMRLDEMAGKSVIKDRDDVPSAGAMVEDLCSDHERVAHRLHALATLSEKHGDIVTADLATARSAFHEKAAWMLRSVIAE